MAVVTRKDIGRTSNLRRERNSNTTGALNSERGNEHQKFCTAADCSSQNIIILQEPFRISFSYEELHEETNCEVHHHRRIDTDRKVTKVPAYHGCDEVVEACFGEVSMGEVEGQGNGEADWEGKNDPLVGSADAEHVFGKSPKCNCLKHVSLQELEIGKRKVLR